MIENPVLKAFLAGSLSGTCSTILFQPLDLVKTRLQTPLTASVRHVTGTQVGMLNIIGHIIQKEQLFGLWRGMTPSLTRCVPGVGLYFSSVHFLKSNFITEEPGALQALAIGITARTLSAASLIPITVIKTRFESGIYHYGSIGGALKVIYSTEGFRGLCSGLIPTIFRDAPFSGLYLMFYSQTKKVIPKELFQSDFSAPLHFSCGVVAGIMASVATQPADVIKTKMQLFPNKFNGVVSVIVYVNSKYGLKGYFKGLIPRMLRRTLMSAMAWTVYEQITRRIGLK